MPPLVKLTQLTELYLDNNKIEDIRFLTVLQQLKVLCLDHNPIRNLRPLESLRNLTTQSQPVTATNQDDLDFVVMIEVEEI